MKTVVLGQIIENVYEVDHKWKEIIDSNGKLKTVYTAKPTITKNRNTKEWKEICSFKGEPRYNNQHDYFKLKVAYVGGNYVELNISETETVTVHEEIFRADLNELHLHTGKVIKETDVNKEEALSTVETQIKAFNKMMIESNSQLMAYCNLHKLSYEDTDCIELFKLVFPGKEYEIIDGVMKVKEYCCGALKAARDYTAYDCTTAISSSTYADCITSLDSRITVAEAKIDGLSSTCIASVN